MSLLEHLKHPAEPPAHKDPAHQPPRLRSSPAAGGRTEHEQDRLKAIRDRVQRELILRSDIKNLKDSPEMRRTIEQIFCTVLEEEGIVLSRAERANLLKTIADDIVGLGPLEVLLDDEATTDIMVVGKDKVYVERGGHIQQTTLHFEDEDHLRHIIDRIVVPLGRRVDENSPMVDARLKDGSRVNAVVRPVALDGPTLTIRKFSVTPFTEVDLIRFGTATPEVFEFLRATVIAGFNTLVCGGSSSGKTTLLNVLSGFIPEDERIVTIENAAELRLRQPHVVRLETRPPNVEGQGELTVRELVINALRMRPDRIVVGEVRSAEAIDLLQAMNTGHEGSMGTLHANSARDALARVETMCMSSGLKMPVRAIRDQLSSAVNLIVHMARTRDGVRRIVQIAEVNGMEGDIITLTDLFAWEQQVLAAGQIIGELKPSGLLPQRIDQIQRAGIYLPPLTFGVHPKQESAPAVETPLAVEIPSAGETPPTGQTLPGPIEA